MEHNTSFKNKTGSNAVTTHSHTNRNIPWGLSFAITLLYSTYCINTQLNYGNEMEVSHLLYMDDLKLLGRNEDDLENEIKIVQAISKDIYMKSGLEKCAKICLKKGRV